MSEQLKDEFESIREAAQSLPADSSRILTVPVWGWTGDGKTCSILTLFHYADPVMHGLGLAYADDGEELSEALGDCPEYRDLPLLEIARSTADRLTGLAETFMDDGDWPPGTDAPTPYFLKIRGVRRTFGFVYLPDLQGGSFRANDPTAQLVLRNAHGCAVLVDPTRYSGTDVDSKRYRDAVDGRVQRCVEKELPVAVMITKADDLPPDNREDVDKAHLRLGRIIDGAADARVFRVSIAGAGAAPNVEDPNLPPDHGTRTPSQLLAAWMWLLSTALKQNGESVRTRPPQLRLQAAATQALGQLSTVTEVRLVGEYSNTSANALLPLGTDRRNRAFLLLDGDGLYAMQFPLSGDAPTKSTVGTVPGVSDLDTPVVQISSGGYYVGERSGAQHIWYGSAGDALARLPLPFRLSSWAGVGDGRVVGVDDAGRLHLLGRSGSQFQTLSYVGDFLAPDAGFICCFRKQGNVLLVANGDELAAVQVTSSGFGERLETSFSVQYVEDDEIELSALGSALVIPSTAEPGGAALFWTPTGEHEIPYPPAEVVCSAVSGNRVAWCTSTEVHVGFDVKGDFVVATRPASLPAVPQFVCWDSSGASLLVVLEGGRCALLSVLGFPNV